MTPEFTRDHRRRFQALLLIGAAVGLNPALADMAYASGNKPAAHPAPARPAPSGGGHPGGGSIFHPGGAPGGGSRPSIFGGGGTRPGAPAGAGGAPRMFGGGAERPGAPAGASGAPRVFGGGAERPGAPAGAGGAPRVFGGGGERPGTPGGGGEATRVFGGARPGTPFAGHEGGFHSPDGMRPGGPGMGATRSGFRSVQPGFGGRGQSPAAMQAMRRNDGWEARAHYPERRQFVPTHYRPGDPRMYRDHFQYFAPQPFYRANMGAFVEFVPVAVGVLAVTEVADAAPSYACVDRAAAMDVQNGSFYADGPPPPDAPPVPQGVVCNQAMINGVTAAQTESAAAQLADAAAQGQTSGTLTVQDENGRSQTMNFTTEDSYTGVAEVDMPLLDGVEAPASGANIPRNPFRTVNVQSRLRVRSAPSEQDSKVTGEYEPGQVVQVQAITADGNWALVAFGGFGVGYVSVHYLADAPARTTAAAVARPQRPTPPPTAVAAARPARHTKPTHPDTPPVVASGPAQFNVYKVHALAPCQTFVIDNKMRNQACGFGGGTMAYNSDVPKLQS